ncbi:tRNA-dihydrouridine synthase 4 [Rhodotorula toruloides]|uniref:tRNA-dihydrouridine synthase 4 n=1 Tax=Rhodotorula toruloides TaxID=5286 RepID=A0A511KMD0_RHOTO|nr:tRNA-dihydrouridine synthase 4 [Rhodotorula toruloides]
MPHSVGAQGVDEAHGTAAAEELLPQDILRDFEGVNACAPMVRYGKLPFRALVSRYETHLVWTPMMLAAEFSRSALARDSDFTTSSTERGEFYLAETYAGSPVAEWDPSTEPRRGLHSMSNGCRGGGGGKRRRKVKGRLIIQFAANDPVQLADASELAKPWVDGIDLNCGCPQKWAFQEGIGCALLRKPDLVRDLVRTTKQRIGWDFPVSVKIRVDDDPSRTNELVSNAIAGGADFITVHGRTRHQSSEGYPVNPEAIAFASSCAKGAVPVIANGDVFAKEDGEELRKKTGVQGVMSARGLLANPALFAGYSQTPLQAVQEFVDLSISTGLIFPLFHRHVAYMLESRFANKKDRIGFNGLTSYGGVLDWLEESQMIEFGDGSGLNGVQRGVEALRV